LNVVTQALLQKERLCKYLLQECNMKKFFKNLWLAWNEARIAYANRFARHRLGS
jgi:hypothetical protein